MEEVYKKNRGVYKTKIRIHVKIETIREQLKTKLWGKVTVVWWIAAVSKCSICQQRTPDEYIMIMYLRQFGEM